MVTMDWSPRTSLWPLGMFCSELRIFTFLPMRRSTMRLQSMWVLSMVMVFWIFVLWMVVWTVLDGL